MARLVAYGRDIFLKIFLVFFSALRLECLKCFELLWDYNSVFVRLAIISSAAVYSLRGLALRSFRSYLSRSCKLQLSACAKTHNGIRQVLAQEIL